MRSIKGMPENLDVQSIVPSLEAEINIELMRRWAVKNHISKAIEILNVVKNSKVKIHVVTWRCSDAGTGFTSFDSDCPLPGEGTIYINLDAWVRVQDVRGQQGSSVYNNFILIIHELGHAKQYIEQPGLFSISGAEVSQSPGGISHAEAVASYTRIQNKMQNLLGINYGKAKTVMLRHRGKPPNIAFASPIEWDNYIQHEGPVCDQAKLARRNWYGNIDMFYPHRVR